MQSRLPRKGAPDCASTINLPRLLSGGALPPGARQLQQIALLDAASPHVKLRHGQGVQRILDPNVVDYRATTRRAKAVLLRHHVYASILGL